MGERADLTVTPGEVAAAPAPLQLAQVHDLVSSQTSPTLSSPPSSGSRKRPHGDHTSHKIIEKRRRDRINNCLGELSRLIPVTYVKQGSSKLEKAEILEMTVEHLKRLTDQQENSNHGSTSQQFQGYQSGYLQCVNEVRHYLLKEEGYSATDERLTRLVDHLNERASMPATCNSSIATTTSSVSVGSGHTSVSLAFCASPMTRTSEAARSAVTSPNHSLTAGSRVLSPPSTSQSMQALSATPHPQQQPPAQAQLQQQMPQAPHGQAQQHLPQPTGSPLVLTSQVLQPSQLQLTVLQSDVSQGQLSQQPVQSAQQVLAHLGLAGDASLQPANVSFASKAEPGSLPYCVAVAGQVVGQGGALPASSAASITPSQLAASPLPTGTVIPTGQFLQVQQGSVPTIAQLMVAAPPQLSVLQPAVQTHTQSSTAVSFPQPGQGTMSELPNSRPTMDSTAYNQGVTMSSQLATATSQQQL